jgi:hypothetical protein
VCRPSASASNATTPPCASTSAWGFTARPPVPRLDHDGSPGNAGESRPSRLGILWSPDRLRRRRLPRRGLAPSTHDEERAAGRVVDVLAGAAAALVALHVFLAVDYVTADEFPRSEVGNVVAERLTEVLWQGGLLLGAAAVVHLLDRQHRAR